MFTTIDVLKLKVPSHLIGFSLQPHFAAGKVFFPLHAFPLSSVFLSNAVVPGGRHSYRRRRSREFCNESPMYQTGVERLKASKLTDNNAIMRFR